MKIDLEQISTAFRDVEFFLACVFPDSPPQFGAGVPPGLAVESSDGFWAVTSRARGNGKSLLHEISGMRVLFRGYEGARGVHSYSGPERIARLAEPDLLENGVFVYLGFDPEQQQAVVRNDALGVAPLFYRRCGDSWFFASHPGLIHFTGDEPDLTTWLSLMQNGHVMGDQSFYEGISRVGSGTQMTIRRDGIVNERWSRYDDLPAGAEMIDEQAFAMVEDAYLRAIERCLALDADAFTLPFSSGFDSRRFFATLLQKKVPFKAVTCQTFHRRKGRDYDIDSHFAPKIAAAFGVECELVHASPPNRLAADARHRQNLIGTETFMHSWAVPLMRWLADRPPSIVFDGLAGDTLGNSGYEIDGLHENPEKDTELLVKETSKPGFFRQLSGMFQTLPEYQARYRAYLGQYAPNLNRAEFAFLQSRTRRCISPWITMMHPPGHVVVFPYCDMDFARTTLRYHPAEKYKWFFQKECLKRFYPEFVDFAGSRNLPPDHAPLDMAESHARDGESERYLYGDVSTVLSALKYLSWMNRILLLLAWALPFLRSKRGWLFRPLLSLVRVQREGKIFVKRESTKSQRSVGSENDGVDHVPATNGGTA